MKKKTDDELKQDMLEDLGLDPAYVYDVPTWLAELIDKLISRGWKKP